MTLLEAIQSGEIESVRTVLNEAPDSAVALSPQGVSMLMMALYHQRREMADLIREKLSRLTFFEAAALGDLSAIEAAVQASPEVVNEHSNDGFTGLGFAAFFGHEDCARYLLSAGADPNRHADNAFGVYPIHSASAGEAELAVRLVRLLIEHGAKVNVRQQNAVTPLHQAASTGNGPLIELLLENEAIAISTDDGKMPVDYALERGHDDVVGLLR